MAKQNIFEGSLPKPDKRGRIRVWDVHAKEWRECFPIDAREMLAQGSALLEKPAEKAPTAAGGGAGGGKPKGSESGAGGGAGGGGT